MASFVFPVIAIIMAWQYIRAREAQKWLFIPPLASQLMSVSFVENAGSLSGRQSAPFFWPAEQTGAFFLMYPGMAQSMQVKKTKPVSCVSTAAHLCSCLQRVPESSGSCLPMPFGLLTCVKELMNKRPYCQLRLVCWWSSHLKTCTSTLRVADGVAPVTCVPVWER